MPVVRITTSRSVAERLPNDMLHQTRESLMSILGAPSEAFILLLDQPAHDELAPQAAGDYLLAEIMLFPGRSNDTKREVYNSLCSLCGRHGIRSEALMMVFVETRSENWFLPGAGLK